MDMLVSIFSFLGMIPFLVFLGNLHNAATTYIPINGLHSFQSLHSFGYLYSFWW